MWQPELQWCANVRQSGPWMGRREALHRPRLRGNAVLAAAGEQIDSGTAPVGSVIIVGGTSYDTEHCPLGTVHTAWKGKQPTHVRVRDAPAWRAMILPRP